jgi:NAD(P)-dependent dehydrogenase (short-subunit alcohol dehydrogenase family)
VTGGARGLGRAYSELLARRGARVIVNDFGGEVDGSGGSSQAADEAVAEIVAAGGQAVAAPADISVPEGGQAVVDTAMSAYGQVDIVVHNAGAGQTVERCLGIHLLGAFYVLTPAWKIMRSREYGRIVLTTSSVATFSRPAPLEGAGPENLAYSAAKGGLLGLAHDLAFLGKSLNINVNAIAPYGRSRMNAGYQGEHGSFGPVLGRFFAHARPEQVAAAVGWLVHEDCTASHQIIAAGSGRVCRTFIGETIGFVKPELTVEDVRDHWDAVQDRDGYQMFDNGYDEIIWWTERIAGREPTRRPHVKR